MPAIVEYLNKNDFDVVCLQEVTNGKFSPTGTQVFDVMQKQTKLKGFMSPYIGFRGDPSSYFANATFWSPKFKLVTHETIWLKRYQEYTTVDFDYRKTPRSALATTVAIERKELLVINAHLAWGYTSDERAYQTHQATKLYKWLKANQSIPFVLTGDFNLNPEAYSVEKLSFLGINCTTKFHIANTLNPRIHKAKNLFPPGLAVDYIIVDKRLGIKKFWVEEALDLSDHLGLVVEFTI